MKGVTGGEVMCTTWEEAWPGAELPTGCSVKVSGTLPRLDERGLAVVVVGGGAWDGAWTRALSSLKRVWKEEKGHEYMQVR